MERKINQEQLRENWDRKYDSAKSGQFESEFMSRKREQEHLVENRRRVHHRYQQTEGKKNENSRDHIECIDAWRSGDKISLQSARRRRRL